MLLFVTVVLSVLLGFVAMESQAFVFEQKTRMTEDVARIMDAAGNGGNITYDPPVQTYNLTINSAEKSVSVDGISRHFLVNASDALISNSPELTIGSNKGVVYVKG
jgi:hypothetical protein